MTLPERFLLRGMLWSLAFAAVTGVLAVLFAAGDRVWRVTGTGFVTALACGVMLPVSGMVDRAKTRSSGLLGMAVIIAEYVMGLLLIWDIPSTFFISVDENVAITMALLAGAAVVSMLLLQLMRETYGVTAARVGLAITTTAFGMFMVANWAPADLRSGPWWESGWVLLLCGAMGTIALVRPTAGDGRSWRWLGVVAGSIACALWLTDVWVGTGSDPGFVVFVLAFSAACVVAYANLAGFCPLTPGQGWVRVVSVASAIAASGLIALIAIHEKAYPLAIDEDLLIRAGSACGIVAGCGGLALCVFARVNRRVDFECELARICKIVVICPRCRRRQAVSLGGSVCRTCGLRIAVEVEEPRCPQCDYLLLGLTTDRCPECGHVISEPARHT